MADALAAPAAPALGPIPPVRIVASAAEKGMRVGLWLATLFLLCALVLPLAMLFLRSFQGHEGEFVWLANYVSYVTTPALLFSIWNSVWTAGLTAIIVVPAAFAFAYAIMRSRIPGKPLLRAIALVPV